MCAPVAPAEQEPGRGVIKKYADVFSREDGEGERRKKRRHLRGDRAANGQNKLDIFMLHHPTPSIMHLQHAAAAVYTAAAAGWGLLACCGVGVAVVSSLASETVPRWKSSSCAPPRATTDATSSAPRCAARACSSDRAAVERQSNTRSGSLCFLNGEQSKT